MPEVGIIENPRFEDFHPAYAQPWRVLVCCYHDTAGYTLYSIDEIEESNAIFTPIEQMQAGDERDVNESKQITGVLNFNNSIINGSQNAGWNPVLRIVIGRTDNL